MGATAVNPAVPSKRGALGGVSARLLRVAPDERLVALVRRGDQRAFEALYDRHHRPILSFCRHMLGSREEAEDALQHTFMAAYKNLVGSDKEIQLRAWLFAIARNRCLSVLRARREQPSDEIELVSVEGLAAQVERRSDLQDLVRDLGDLPEDQRAALVLSELGDLGHDEIAAVLDCPKDKVKALVFQARSSLHQSREARETSCEEIREMLSTLSGGSLRRTPLRRHVKSCAGCQAFEAEVKRQRGAMAILLPVVPTLGLKESALAAAFGQTAAGGAAVAGGAAAVAGGSALAGSGVSAIVAKVLVVATVAGGGAAGVNAVSGDGDRGGSGSTPATESAPPPAGAPPVVAPAASPEPAAERNDKAEQDKPRRSRKARRRGHDDRGKEFAKSRGKGKKHGLNGTQPGRGRQAEKGAPGERGQGREKAANRREQSKQRRNARAKPQRPRRQTQSQRPQPKPKPQSRPAPAARPAPAQDPQPEPEPTAAPEPTPTAEPEPSPAPGKGRS